MQTLANQYRPSRFTRPSQFDGTETAGELLPVQSRTVDRPLNRHFSLVGRRRRQVNNLDYRPSVLSASEGRQRRLNSWACGTHPSLFNPQCPIHGHRALIEAFSF